MLLLMFFFKNGVIFIPGSGALFRVCVRIQKLKRIQILRGRLHVYFFFFFNIFFVVFFLFVRLFITNFEAIFVTYFLFFVWIRRLKKMASYVGLDNLDQQDIGDNQLFDSYDSAAADSKSHSLVLQDSGDNQLFDSHDIPAAGSISHRLVLQDNRDGQLLNSRDAAANNMRR